MWLNVETIFIFQNAYITLMKYIGRKAQKEVYPGLWTDDWTAGQSDSWKVK